MNIEDKAYTQYKDTQHTKWQSKILLISWLIAPLVLGTEVSTYLTLLNHGQRATLSFFYIFIRIIVPTILNFGSLLVTSVLLKSNKISVSAKNNIVSFCVLVICGVVAIFHNYFQVFLITPAFAFFVCSVFGEPKILRRLFITSIPICAISLTAFWLDPDSKGAIYKILTLIYSIAFNSCAYIFSKVAIRSQAAQLSYINKSYEKQLELVEELKIEPLTKLYNRVAMMGTINRILTRTASETINPFLVIMDIDFFKRINDKYGHTSGDEVLVTLAEIIKKNMHSRRRAFRYGGEEFVLIFEDSMPSHVIYTVQSIRSDFANTKFSFAPKESITLSAGISPLSKDFDSKAWIDNADECLYYAKEHGRNQIKTAVLP